MNRNERINGIIREYAENLSAQRARNDAALAAVRGDAEFAAIESALNALYIERARLSVPDKSVPYGSVPDESVPDESVAAIDVRIGAAERAYAGYLSARGIATELTYKCPRCRDSGWTGKTLCTCVRQRLHDELLRDSGALPPGDFADADMSVFPEAERRNKQKLYDIFREYCAKFPDTAYRNIILSGGVGVGKSYLVSCAANEILKKGETVQFLSALAFNGQMLKYHLAPVDEKDAYIAPLLETALLIIDDLGSEPILKNVTVEYLYLVMNERLVNKKHTVITTNLHAGEFLSRYGERFMSRALDRKSTFLAEMTGADLRWLGRKADAVKEKADGSNG
jgi:DNA replication protein DnaC